MNVIFTCGGTGGHINPAIAIANTLKERHPDCNILFIGANGGMEEKLVPRAGYAIKNLDSACFARGKNWYSFKYNVKAVGRIYRAVKACKQIIREFKPDVIVGTGGFASYPAMTAGNTLGIPVLVHEANAVPGLTTKLVAGKAQKVLVSFEESAQFYRHPEKVEAVGMPVRREFISIQKAEARAKLGLDERPLVVTAFGSLGARDMNNMVAELMKLEQEAGHPFQHIHATGAQGWTWMPDHLKSLGVTVNDGRGIDMREYIYDMPTVMAAADVFISRAGASSCNEIAASGTPCILIPSPNVTNNHQEKNARVLEKRGAAILVLEPECTAQGIYTTLTDLLSDRQRCSQMSMNLRSMAVLDCAERICDMIDSLAAGKQA
jgi:UDP-N-acetylglucosamine--N-acetylmuramyl-(pentapeptide) pyrophosphoryl-undecaprenol N-acetylglucosamine transferase